jgi:hypothetical protein
MRTRFQNLFYLEKALNRLNIVHKQKQIVNQNSSLSNIDLVIPQSNGYEIEFVWNGQEYDLKLDMSFWEQSFSTKDFIGKIAQKYAGEVVIGESQKIGFQPVIYQQNSDGSTTLVLQRWNNEN